MSATRQAVTGNSGDARSSAADGNASTAYPCDSSSLCMESRNGSSLSTMQIKAGSGTTALDASPEVSTSCPTTRSSTRSRWQEYCRMTLQCLSLGLGQPTVADLVA